jgi:hypothetical protein
MDNFTDFFTNTGNNVERFQAGQAQVMQKAMSFAQKIGQQVSPTLSKVMDNESQRVEDLQSKPELVPGLPNPVLFYGAVAAVALITYRIIFK